MNRLSKTDSAVFLYCRSPLFLKDPFFPDYFEADFLWQNLNSGIMLKTFNPAEKTQVETLDEVKFNGLS